MKYGEIAKKYGIGLSRVKMSVKRTKQKLSELLEKEGY
jgi:DNA-directed RNA polymerase specialized sigma24 family protein